MELLKLFELNTHKQFATKLVDYFAKLCLCKSSQTQWREIFYAIDLMIFAFNWYNPCQKFTIAGGTFAAIIEIFVIKVSSQQLK